VPLAVQRLNDSIDTLLSHADALGIAPRG